MVGGGTGRRQSRGCTTTTATGLPISRRIRAGLRIRPTIAAAIVHTSSRRNVTLPVGYPADAWRLVLHDGRWWFWTPNRTWLYLSGGQWIDWSREAERLARQQGWDKPYGVGYRGGALAIPQSQLPQRGPLPQSSIEQPVHATDEAGMNIDAQH